MSSKFVSSDPDECPIEKLGLYKDALGETLLENSSYVLDETNKLLITPPSSAESFEFYVVASTQALIKQSIKVSLTFTK